MVVSTIRDGKGVLAEYTYSDMKNWNHAGIFMNMYWDRFYECPDVFKMGDWWYLIYSDMYRYSPKVQNSKRHTLEELKKCSNPLVFPDAKERVLDSWAFYAGKTASDGTNCYIWGCFPTRPGNNNTDLGADKEPEWAGNLVAHKIIQHKDGTLSFGLIGGIRQKYNIESDVKETDKTEGINVNNGNYTMNGYSYALFKDLNVHNKISFTVKTTTNADKLDFSFVRGTDSKKIYSIFVNPEANNKRKINFEEEEEKGKDFIDGINGYMFETPPDNMYKVTICTDNSVCVVYINENVAYTNRIYGIQKNSWSINSYLGKIEVSNLKVSYY